MLNHKIIGDDIQAVDITLDLAQSLRAETGTLLYMQDGIEMQTNAEGGMLSSFKRLVVGESFFITTFTNNSDKPKSVAFAAPYPGKIFSLQLDGTKEFLCQRDSYLCGEHTINIDIAFTKKLGAGFFGGEGFVLQKLSGSGEVFIHGGGTVIEKDLEAGEKLHVDTGCLVGFDSKVDYDIQMLKGFKNILFGGEGIFLAHLTGPGKVYLQSLPFSRIADKIISASTGVLNNSGESKGLGGIGQSLLKNVISGN